MSLSPEFQQLSAVERESAQEYDSFLEGLSFNSKVVINNLTRIAEENPNASNAIACAVEARIAHSPPDRQLPFLYLLDSIVKNVGGAFVPRFRANLAQTFVGAFDGGTAELRNALKRLLSTWPPYFGAEVCQQLWRQVVQLEEPRSPPPPRDVAAPPPKRARYEAPAPPLQPPPPREPQNDTMAQLDRHTELLTSKVVGALVAGQLPSVEQCAALDQLVNFKLQHTSDPARLSELVALQAQVRLLMQQQNQQRPSAAAVPSGAAAAAAALVAAAAPALPMPSAPELFASQTPAAAAAPPPPPPACRSFSQIKSQQHAASVALLYDDLPKVCSADGWRFKDVDAMRKHLDWLFERNKQRRARQQKGGAHPRRWFMAEEAWRAGQTGPSAPTADDVQAIFREAERKKKSAALKGGGGGDDDDEDDEDDGDEDGVGDGTSAAALSGSADSAAGGRAGAAAAAATAAVTTPRARHGVSLRDDDNESCPVCGEGFSTQWNSEQQQWEYSDTIREADGAVVHAGCAEISSPRSSSASPAPPPPAAPSSLDNRFVRI